MNLIGIDERVLELFLVAPAGVDEMIILLGGKPRSREYYRQLRESILKEGVDFKKGKKTNQPVSYTIRGAWKIAKKICSNN